MATIVKTLDDIINQKDRFDVNNITFFTATDDGTLVIRDHDLFEVYYRFIIPYVGTYSVTERQRRYYRGKPQLLSLDTYGTPKLSWLILMLNDRECASKFYLKQTVRLIPSKILTQMYDKIVTKSAGKLNANWNIYLRMVGENVPTK